MSALQTLFVAIAATFVVQETFSQYYSTGNAPNSLHPPNEGNEYENAATPKAPVIPIIPHVSYIIVFKKGHPKMHVVNRIIAHGGKITHHLDIINGISARFPATRATQEFIEALRRNYAVNYIEKDLGARATWEREQPANLAEVERQDGQYYEAPHVKHVF